MGIPFGSLLQEARQNKNLTIEVVAKLSKISEDNLWAFESNRLIPLPEEIEALISVLEMDLNSAKEMRESVNVQHRVSSDAIGIEVLSEEPGGVHPWAQAIFSTELSTEGPRMSVLGYLSARVRPIELTLKQYIWDGVAANDLLSIRDILQRRRASWLQNLAVYSCRDIYPKSWIEKYCRERIWFGRVLEPIDVIHHVEAVEAELTNNRNYEIGLLTDEELYYNFIIQGPYLLLEGGYEVEPKAIHRFVGGLRISIPSVVDAFILEFERLWNQTRKENKDKAYILKWFQKQREQLEELAAAR